ncbi:pectate lyase [Cyclobacterium jeungdonense]|uniref:Pectate lyase n=1 Tax=Cyclobacterium jeungdonense TaxID=708087 RepID=A0ABT8C9T2_9BACT|nr:pectate lyase [Cyclobacterium jeungdonense]MDN3689559.1 pectate lyase [Cyclobacterium jeungdonense]
MYPRPQFATLVLLFTLFLYPPHLKSQSQENIPWGQVLEQDASWYGSDQAVRIAENILLHQKENGGWYKNIDMSEELTNAEKESLIAEKSDIIGTTLDNDAGFIQIEYLARVYQETGDTRYENAALAGIDYLLEAQYENGGWPQYYPLREGYYTHITYNDGAMIQAMNLLRSISKKESLYAFAGNSRRKKAQQAIDKGLEIILASQIQVDGQLTAWCAQIDREDLSPVKARAYELPSISGSESVGIVRYLMQLEQPDEAVIQAIESAVRWFEEVKLENIRLDRVENPDLPQGYDRIVVPDKNAEPLWARFYEIGTNRPMFVGRDSVVRYALSEIEHERRIGYSYLGAYAKELLEIDFPNWKRRMGDL